jgi:hypothetical protein
MTRMCRAVCSAANGRRIEYRLLPYTAGKEK